MDGMTDQPSVMPALFRVDLTHEQVQALYLTLLHARDGGKERPETRPAFGWMEQPLVDVEELLKPIQNHIHDRMFNAMNRQFFGDDRMALPVSLLATPASAPAALSDFHAKWAALPDYMRADHRFADLRDAANRLCASAPTDADDAARWRYWKPWLERRVGDLAPYEAQRIAALPADSAPAPAPQAVEVPEVSDLLMQQGGTSNGSGMRLTVTVAPQAELVCKLTECQGQPRCGKCLAMDQRYRAQAEVLTDEWQKFAEAVRDGIADYAADNWTNRNWKLSEIETAIRDVEIRADRLRAILAAGGAK